MMSTTPQLPSVSVTVATLNSARSLRRCLSSVHEQDYPAERVSIIVADGGSTDETLAIAREYEVDQVLANPLQTGEAGKAVALRAASGAVA
jgi:glycosyltransferase involved in cell wall biosynthesis